MHFEKNLIIVVGVVGQLGFGDFWEIDLALEKFGPVTGQFPEVFDKEEVRIFVDKIFSFRIDEGLDEFLLEMVEFKRDGFEYPVIKQENELVPVDD